MRTPVYAPVVRNDPAGLGHFGAPRGRRLHQGVDLVSEPGNHALAPHGGTVRRLIRVYDPVRHPDRSHLRGIEIESSFGGIVVRSQILYVMPDVGAGEQVKIGQPVGIVQDVAAVHSAEMVNHVHWQVEIVGVLLHPGRVGRAFVEPLALTRG